MLFKRTYQFYLGARKFARSLKLENTRAWRQYCKENYPVGIPTQPHIIYKRCGWLSWMDWLGNNNKQGGQRKYTVNNNYFKKWSSDMAYILGFWFADGCIKTSKNGSYCFCITQHKNDKYLLEKMLKEMQSNYPLKYDKRGCYNLFVVSKIIYNDIIKLGGKERKSLDVKFPHVPKKYLPDFIRGLWDGDGTIYYNNCHKNYWSAYSSASKGFIEQLYIILKENIPNLGGCISTTSKIGKNEAYKIMFSINNVIRLKKFMYKDISNKIFLRRKYDVFLKAEQIHISHQYNFLSYNNAQNFVGQLGLKRWEDWGIYCKSGLRHRNIPSAPEKFYKNKGWIDWSNWLGYAKKTKNNRQSIER